MTTTQTSANGAAAKAAKGLLLPCPLCGEQGASISLYLDDMDTCHCRDCDNEFSLDTVRDLLAKWSRVLAWADSAPTAE
jgi:hypothetical protein